MSKFRNQDGDDGIGRRGKDDRHHGNEELRKARIIIFFSKLRVTTEMGWLVTKVITYRMDQQEKIRKSENIQQEEQMGRRV